MKFLAKTVPRFIVTTIIGILLVWISFSASKALTPMNEDEMRSVQGGDGADLSFKLLLNNGDNEGAGGTIFLGGGAGSILHESGNQGFLSMGDVSSNFTWSFLRTDVISTGTKPVVSIRMNDVDDVSGMFHVDQIGVTKSGSLASSNVPANLMGDVTLEGTYDLDGRIQAFPN